jgi:hypothetical protein
MIVTYELLKEAIFNKMGVTSDIASDLAFRLLNYFGFNDETIDNALDQEDRRMFYFLQDVQILSTNWEEIVLPSGRTWRVFYWSLNVSNILKFAEPYKEAKIEQIELYESLPADVWMRSAA